MDKIYKFLFSIMTILLLVSCGGKPTPEELEKICTSDVDGKDRVPPLVIDEACFSPKSLCPVYPKLNQKHRMILVDTTEKLTKGEVSLLKKDVFEPNTTLLREIEPYTRVSVLDINDHEDVVGTKTLVSMCRPQSGRQGTPFAADPAHPSTGQVFIQSQFTKWALSIWKTSEKLAESEKAKYSAIFEYLESVTKTAAYQFRAQDYPERTLVLFSDLQLNTDRFNFRSLCKTWNKCQNFESFMKRIDKDDREYLNEIKPSFYENSKVMIYHVIPENIKGKPLENDLKVFWFGYFKWAGIKEENIKYRRLVDSSET